MGLDWVYLSILDVGKQGLTGISWVWPMATDIVFSLHTFLRCTQDQRPAHQTEIG